MIGQDSELSYFLQLILTFNATKNIRATNLCLNQENSPSGEDFILHEDGSGIVTKIYVYALRNKLINYCY